MRWLLSVKCLYLSLVVACAWYSSDFDVEQFRGVNVRWPRSGDPVFGTPFATWDGAHYLYLSEIGYSNGMPSCAFYPLWPLTVRWLSPFTGGSHIIAGLVLSNAFSLMAWFLFYWLVAQRCGGAVANWALILLIVFPGSLFYQFIYSESLFFLLVMLLWYGLEQRHYHVAWLAACLLPLTRAVGVFAVLPVAWHALKLAPPRWWGKLVQKWKWLEKIGQGTALEGGQRQNVCAMLAEGRTEPGLPAAECGFVKAPGLLLVAPLVGWGCYLALMWHWTGNAFEGFKAQRYWGVHSVLNLVNLPKFIAGMFTPTEWHEFAGSLLDRCVFVLFASTLLLIWRVDRGLLVWAYWLGILPAMSGTFTSYTRYASCAFPMFIALGVFLAAKHETRSGEVQTTAKEAGTAHPQQSAIAKRQSAFLFWLKWILLAGFAVLHVVLAWRFVNFRWAG